MIQVGPVRGVPVELWEAAPAVLDSRLRPPCASFIRVRGIKAALMTGCSVSSPHLIHCSALKTLARRFNIRIHSSANRYAFRRGRLLLDFRECPCSLSSAAAERSEGTQSAALGGRLERWVRRHFATESGCNPARKAACMSLGKLAIPLTTPGPPFCQCTENWRTSAPD